MMNVQDDRTPEQLETHTELVVGFDSYMSGWGRAEGGNSYAGWACHPYHTDAVLSWVENRNDLGNIRVEDGDYVPSGKGHFHIYVVNENHPAVRNLKKLAS